MSNEKQEKEKEDQREANKENLDQGVREECDIVEDANAPSTSQPVSPSPGTSNGVVDEDLAPSPIKNEEEEEEIEEEEEELESLAPLDLIPPSPAPSSPLTCNFVPPGGLLPVELPGSLSSPSSLPRPFPSSVSPSRGSSSEDIVLPASVTNAQKSYDYLLKVLLVGDSDVGKQEILSEFEDGTTESPFCSSEGAAFKQTIILIDGKRVKLQLWDTSGQGRFCTIIRSYSRGAQGILLVYDITNKWSFEGIDRWLKEVDQHAPGIPKVLIGNRLHLAFKRQVDQSEAECYAEKNAMGFFEVSPLVNFNISESFVELARMALKRNGMERLWRSNKVSSLYELCAHSIVNRTTVYGIDRLPLPESVKQNLKSYALTNYSTLRHPGGSHYKSVKHKRRSKQMQTPADAANVRCGGVSRKSCTIS